MSDEESDHQNEASASEELEVDEDSNHGEEEEEAKAKVPDTKGAKPVGKQAESKDGAKKQGQKPSSSTMKPTKPPPP